MTSSEAVKELERYIRDEYEGRICDALESIGGIRLVRAVLGWDHHATLDSRLYIAPPVEEKAPGYCIKHKSYGPCSCECLAPYVPFTTSDACWCQPFDGPAHPNCPMHGEKLPPIPDPNQKCSRCQHAHGAHGTISTACPDGQGMFQ